MDEADSTRTERTTAATSARLSLRRIVVAVTIVAAVAVFYMFQTVVLELPSSKKPTKSDLAQPSLSSNFEQHCRSQHAVLLSTQRSGTRWVLDLLGHTPHIVDVPSEPFMLRRLKTLLKKMGTPENVSRYVVHESFSSKLCTSKQTCIFKLMYGQVTHPHCLLAALTHALFTGQKLSLCLARLGKI